MYALKNYHHLSFIFGLKVLVKEGKKNFGKEEESKVSFPNSKNSKICGISCKQYFSHTNTRKTLFSGRSNHTEENIKDKPYDGQDVLKKNYSKQVSIGSNF